MDNIKQNPTNLEILKLAKELAYSDYNNRKAELHNQWVAESDYMWRTQKLRVAYPPIPQFPTEEEIARRAERLLAFILTPRPDLKDQKAINEVKELIEEVSNKELTDEPLSTVTEIIQNDNTQQSESVFDKLKKVWR